MFRIIVLAFLFLNFLHYEAESAKILIVFPFPGKSQFIAGEAYFKELAAKGHDVTMVSGHPQKIPIKNYRDVPVMAIHDGYAEMVAEFARPLGLYEKFKHVANMVISIQTKILDNPEVQNLMLTEKFDIVIVDAWDTELLLGLGPHFNASLIAISTMGTQPSTDDLVGNSSPLSYIIHPLAEFSEINNIWDRWQNLKHTTISKLFHHFEHLSIQNELFKKYFPNIAGDLYDLRKNVSLVLLNTHLTFGDPRPYVPNMIEVGGFHINHKPAPLPEDIDKFINESENGVIYFSMGSNIRSSEFPNEIIRKILKTFAALPERVLWKFENPILPGKPDNVFVSTWFPQPDILAHPKVKLFITHCGQLSSIEALHHGKPVLGFPAFLDQFLNGKRLERLGFGIISDINTIDIKTFNDLIRTIIDDSKYTKSAQKHSQVYHDQPMRPLDTAIYWTEYIIRHNGALHLRNGGQKLNFIQYFNIDIFAIIFTIVVFSLLLVVKIFCKLGQSINKLKKTSKNTDKKIK